MPRGRGRRPTASGGRTRSALRASRVAATASSPSASSSAGTAQGADSGTVSREEISALINVAVREAVGAATEGLRAVPGAHAASRSGSHGLVMGRLQRPVAVAALIDAGLAPGTRKFYATVWDRIARGHLRGGVLSFPISVNAVADYLASLFQEGCGPSTMMSHASAIAYGHKIRGMADPTADFRIKQLLRGAGRFKVSADQRRALSIQEVQALCSKLYVAGLPRVDRLAFRAIFLLGFFGLLRPGELVKGIAPQHTIRLCDVTVSKQRLVIRIPSSKTSPGPHVLTFNARPDTDFCPVRAVGDFIQVRPQGDSQLFVDARGSAISTARLSKVLKRTALLHGMSSSGISGHCLRIGGASHGALQGMSELQLAEAGRWRSRAVRRYFRGTVSVLDVS
ncbi:uncharacterized protein LOC122385681 [Amphibalanus amphitrite]|uniref:uncharacterized protein LOC122385681 n=1 Tax=Amphibalanus amphitrite TaxID=1232801 RepID=UPI001C914BFC|nr:uncharacterized protein LOC122385681 [Amphibalanus amphitrite]